MLRPGDIRRIQERHALVVAGNAPPIIAKLRRCFDGTDGRLLKDELDTARKRVSNARTERPDLVRQTAAALAYARDNQLTPTPATGENSATLAGVDPSPLNGWSW